MNEDKMRDVAASLADHATTLLALPAQEFDQAAFHRHAAVACAASQTVCASALSDERTVSAAVFDAWFEHRG